MGEDMEVGKLYMVDEECLCDELSVSIDIKNEDFVTNMINNYLIFTYNSHNPLGGMGDVWCKLTDWKGFLIMEQELKLGADYNIVDILNLSNGEARRFCLDSYQRVGQLFNAMYHFIMEWEQ